MITAASVEASADGNSRPNSAERSVAILLGAIAFVVALQIALALTKSINWDEFYHFSEIHARLAGQPVDALQTPYSYLFGFVTDWPGSTIDHIRYTRLLILPFEALLVGSVVIAARRFVALAPAIASGLLYLSAGYVFTQALSLRADIIAASLIMAAVAFGLHRPARPLTLCIIALLCALAFVSTIKILLYAPALFGVLVIRRDALKAAWPVLLSLAIGAMAIAAATAVTNPEVPVYLIDKLTRAAMRMFGGGVLPQGRYSVRQVVFAIPFAVTLAAFFPWMWRSAAPREHKIALVLFVLPAFWPLLFFNSYPYFYAFVLPPVAVGLAPVVAIAIQRYGTSAFVVACMLSALLLWAKEPREQLAVQQALNAQVREFFPQPVSYIDESGMIGDYPRAVSHYASGWALAKYWTAGEAEYRASVLNDTVPLLITNSDALANVFAPTGSPDRLLPEDEAFLRANYIPHAGMIHVAGKRLAPGEHLPDEFVATPGTYRVEGGRVQVGGRVFAPGATVQLDRGRHDLVNLTATPGALRWADAGSPKDSAITLRDMFTDF